jgi:CMP-N-acetylneuraminic acid synthetase
MKFFIIIKHNSQRIKKKNFIKIRKLPLWEFFLNKFKKTDQVYIDTDSPQVYGIGKKKFKSFSFYKRKQKFIDYENKGIKSPVLMMIKNFLLEHVTNDNEIIVTTHITSPFIKRTTILDAIKKLKKNEFVHSVTSHQEFAWLKIKNKFKKINFGKNIKKTQNLDPILFSNGAFFIFKKKSFLKYNNRLGKRNYLYNLNFPESFELDDKNDIKIMKNILK